MDVQPITKAAAARKRTIKKKRTQSQIDKQEAPKLWSKIIRSVGHCEHCGGVQNLQAHHIVRKSQSLYLSVELDNGLCLCAKCHMGWWHYDEVRARGWLDQYKGAEFYPSLDERRRLPRKDWTEVRAYLQAKLDEIEKSL